MFENFFVRKGYLEVILLGKNEEFLKNYVYKKFTIILIKISLFSSL